MTTRGLLSIAILISPLQTFADHVGLQIEGGAGSAITTLGAETLARSQHVVGIQYQYLKLDELSDEILLDSEEALHSVGEFSQANISYSLGVSDRLTMSVVLPYVARDDFREASHDHHEDAEEPEHHDEEDAGHHDEVESEGETTSSDISGWGDLSLLGRYALNDTEPGYLSTLFVGIKAPTGSTNEKLANGERAEVEHQPGTGSWDALLGIAYSIPLSEEWGFSSNLLYQLTTEGQRDTEIGDGLMYNAAVVWSPASHSHQGSAHNSHIDQSWQFVLELNGEWRDRTEIDGDSDRNTGGNVVYGTTGLRWSYGSYSLQFSFATPLLTDFNGEQSEPDWRLSSGVSLAF